MSSSDCIVIGAGLAGAAAAWRLGERGCSVTLLERTAPGNAEGSSHGSARIFRYAYANPLYAALVARAKTGWDELERMSGTQLIRPTGAVDFGPLRDPAHLSGVLDSVGIENEVLSAATARERFPQIAFDTDVLWHPSSGVLDAVTTVTTMVGLATATGNVDVRIGWDVAGVARTASGGFSVRSTAGETVEGRRVIVAAGGWLPHLLGDLSLPSAFLDSFPRLDVRQEQAFHMPFRETDPDGRAYPAWPTFIHKSPEIETYGLPGGRDAGFRGQKMAQFNGGRILPSALDRDGRIDPGMRARMVDYAARYLPGLVPEPYAETTCLFTSTSTQDFAIDEANGVVVVSACSGHGGKFAPLLGEFAADLAMGTGTVPEEFRVAAHTAQPV